MNYTERMRERHKETGEGFAVDLGKWGTFWSRGWKGCPGCEQSVHGPVKLYPFREGNTVGWRCFP